MSLLDNRPPQRLVHASARAARLRNLRFSRHWEFFDSPRILGPSLQIAVFCPVHFPSPSLFHSIAIMCATCNAAESNGNTNGASANGTNGTNGSSHEGHTLIKSSHNPHPSHKSSPYAPVGDFLSNVSRFKIIGASSSFRRALSELRTIRTLLVVFESQRGAGNEHR